MLAKYKKCIEVSDYIEFKKVFKIKNDLEGGDGGTDEELILDDLENIEDQTWMVEFHDTHNDGFFKLYLMSDTPKHKKVEEKKDIEIWARLGVVITVPNKKYTKKSLTTALENAVKLGRFEPNGSSYVPMGEVPEYLHIRYDENELEFDV